MCTFLEHSDANKMIQQKNAIYENQGTATRLCIGLVIAPEFVSAVSDYRIHSMIIDLLHVRECFRLTVGLIIAPEFASAGIATRNETIIDGLIVCIFFGDRSACRYMPWQILGDRN